jgi:hypothetical protein
MNPLGKSFQLWMNMNTQRYIVYKLKRPDQNNILMDMVLKLFLLNNRYPLHMMNMMKNHLLMIVQLDNCYNLTLQHQNIDLLDKSELQFHQNNKYPQDILSMKTIQR